MRGLVDISPKTRRLGVAWIVFGGASGLVAMAFSSFEPRKYGVFMVRIAASFAAAMLARLSSAGYGQGSGGKGAFGVTSLYKLHTCSLE